MKNVLKKILPILIATVVFAVCAQYIYRTFQWPEIVYILRNAHLLWLLAAGSLSIILFWFLRSIRWWVLLKSMGVRVGFTELYFCTALSLTLSTVTPLQSGEILKIELLRKHGLMERSPGYGSFLLERMLDISVVFAIALAGAAYRIYGDLAHGSFWVVLAGFVALLSLALCLIWRFPSKYAIADRLKRVFPAAYGGGTMFTVTLLTFGSWFMVAVGWQVCLFSIDLHLSMGKILFMVASLSIVNVLSFIPGAVGIFETGVAEFLLSFGQGAALAQAGAIVLRFQLVLVLVLGIFHYVQWKVRKPPGDIGRDGPQGKTE